jgi:hypothetical protein
VLPLPLAGEGQGGGISAEGFPKRREPSPAALYERADLSRKRERCSECEAIVVLKAALRHLTRA